MRGKSIMKAVIESDLPEFDQLMFKRSVQTECKIARWFIIYVASDTAQLILFQSLKIHP
jgi:hypothetical protein